MVQKPARSLPFKKRISDSNKNISNQKKKGKKDIWDISKKITIFGVFSVLKSLKFSFCDLCLKYSVRSCQRIIQFYNQSNIIFVFSVIRHHLTPSLSLPIFRLPIFVCFVLFLPSRFKPKQQEKVPVSLLKSQSSCFDSFMSMPVFVISLPLSLPSLFSLSISVSLCCFLVLIVYLSQLIALNDSWII